ncbi:hypothetical protein [Pelagimonas varians]|uniref:TFIIB-type domain-containing protein n=1 Tax=Pelagimonas varians TaxID=696760 RepID=A0A238KWA6_9RHOB|nr:hypothetical protein [Pelagimonas varians]PYG27989.1 hypothetical protein C8N36_11319 [Pelagimonas varians]SMX47124.1 hypothetical protein PEV8663_03482 [Pelagimonas varians]
MDPKIATCCYCGTRAALVMDKSHHELVCSSCGAPLHNLKRMRTDAVEGHPYAPSHMTGPARPATHPYGAVDHRKPPKGDYSRKRKKSKKRKSLGRKIFKEAFDLIEDIFD